MQQHRFFDVGLLALVVFAWSTSWIALKAQTGIIAPEVSVFWRFLFAAPFVFIWAWLSGTKLRFSLAEHALIAFLGICIFSTNFIIFYHGAAFLPSGLLSVVFSLASVINLTLAFLLFGERASAKVLVGGFLGFLGVALMFQPEIARAGSGAGVATGLLLCGAGTLSFCVGNMISSRLQRHGIPVVGAAAWGMAYGAIWSAILAVARGGTFTVEWTWPYLGGMVWLVLISTVIAFLSYLTLLGRIGPGRAGYATVLFPVFALAISALFEDYRPSLLALLGLGLVAGGNFLVMRR